MSGITVLIILVLVIFLTWYIAYSFYKKRSERFIEAFLDSNNSINILATTQSITMINKTGLDFFGYNSLNSFLASHSDISDLFLPDDKCIDKYTHGKNWIEIIEKTNNKRVKVKILSKIDMLNHYFHIKISKMQDSKEYILAFSDITEIELEKAAIKKSAELDPLTNIYNRVKLNEMFLSIFFNARKYNKVLTLILFDIDHFKHINDEYGHNIGDRVLQELTGLIRGLLREDEDIFARWGGEEFIVLLQDVPLSETIALASRLRKEIENYSFEVVEKITCSFGVTQFTQGDTQSLFFERVDEALYEAKENGRNQVVTK